MIRTLKNARDARNMAHYLKTGELPELRDRRRKRRLMILATTAGCVGMGLATGAPGWALGLIVPVLLIHGPAP